MLIGYARVSTEDQNLDLQRDALTAAGCERIFEDKASGVRDDRPGLTEALSHLRPGDCLVIWRLDRLGRRMIALLGFVEQLRQRNCDFRIVSGSCPIDTTTASGRLLFHISAALAENERDVIRERTIAGLASARARGRKGGRPAKLTAKQVGTARKMLADPDMTIKEVAEAFGALTDAFLQARHCDKFRADLGLPPLLPICDTPITSPHASSATASGIVHTIRSTDTVVHSPGFFGPNPGRGVWRT